MDTHLYLAFIGISFFTVMSPGPAVLLAISNGLAYDLKAIILSSFANIIALFGLSVIAMFGVGVILKTSVVFFTILKIVGSCYLIYLGIKQFRAKHQNFILEDGRVHHHYNNWKVFQKGFLVAATNPKPILFFTALFPLFLNQNGNVTLQFFVMTGTFMLMSFGALCFYGYLSTAAKALFVNKNKLKIFFKLTGLVFMTMGVGLLFVKEQ
ncbi:LysE family translocator [Sulfurospirillum sp. 1612]|uniref:LysE family translocator n=1 Tax=Sulfurospirillum sp. 1612 TaxID=3094835 RepID=UPI002F94A4E1